VAPDTNLDVGLDDHHVVLVLEDEQGASGALDFHHSHWSLLGLDPGHGGEYSFSSGLGGPKSTAAVNNTIQSNRHLLSQRALGVSLRPDGSDVNSRYAGHGGFVVFEEMHIELLDCVEDLGCIV